MKKTIIIFVILVTLYSTVWADLGDELILAAKDGDLAEVKRLLELGVDVNLQDNDGWTALYWATMFGNTEIGLSQDIGNGFVS